ncbi:hypothetical protein ABZ864_40875 [Streptomyces sp. NPDC047082]|uniref:hypothetical protein n=1 Tax=Streptomyces sp. NPDC047082 TaxID=3155259 RepID=UPI0033F3FBB7
MTGTGRTPVYRVELGKRLAEYLVIADDREAFSNIGDLLREDRIPERLVLHVERLADRAEARDAQWDELNRVCVQAQGALSLVSCRAVSHGHAAHRARREFAMATAAARMAEDIDGHLEHGARGWIAIRTADGRGGGEVYADPFAAQAAQEQPERWTFVWVSPLYPWSVQMCEEHLELIANHERRCQGRVRDYDAFL